MIKSGNNVWSGRTFLGDEFLKNRTVMFGYLILVYFLRFVFNTPVPAGKRMYENDMLVKYRVPSGSLRTRFRYTAVSVRSHARVEYYVPNDEANTIHRRPPSPGIPRAHNWTAVFYPVAK